MNQLGFQSANPTLFFGKNDPEDTRWGECARSWAPGSQQDLLEHLQKSPKGYVLAGYPDDEGVSLSGGRVGAREAPDAIRRLFYRTTANKKSSPHLYDLGNLSTENSLDLRHEMGRETAKHVLQNGHRWIGLGGGHDYGYADGAGFLDTYGHSQPVIINFDAHLDVRPATHGLSSGTPFRRLIEQYEPFELWQVGALKACNSSDHLKWTQSRGSKVHFWEDIFRERSTPGQIFGDLAHRKERPPAFLSIDLDVLSAQYAPGCSSSWPWAMDMGWLMESLQILRNTCDLRAFGFYEVSPPLDLDHRTSKVVAQLLHLLLQD